MLTREYRALRLWLPLHLHGLRAFEQALVVQLRGIIADAVRESS